MSACPFCGQPANSKEHVWAQWLRKYPAYAALQAGKRGERFERAELPVGVDKPATRRIAEGLPNVTAKVCRECNGGWMSRLETGVLDLLGEVMRTDELTGPSLGVAEQTLLATWFAKLAYAYEAAVFSGRNRAWSLQAYRDLRIEQQPPPNLHIWLGKNIELYADIILSSAPLYMISIEENASHTIGWPKMAGAWLSANSVVMYGLWIDPEVDRPGRAEQLVGDDVQAMRKIWPATKTMAWPSHYTTDDQAVSLINLLPKLRDEHGIRVDELRHSEIEAQKAQMRWEAHRDGFTPTHAMVNRIRADRVFL